METLSNIQRITSKTRSPCPVCGQKMPPYPGAISRTDNKTEICSDCGAKEAMGIFEPEDWPGNK